jgi:hypothetical protein
MAAEETRRMVGGGGATTALMTTTTTKTTINKWAAAEAEDDDGWREAGRSGGGGRATVVWWRRRNSTMEDGAEVEDRLGGTGRGAHFFLDEYYLNPNLYNLAKKGGYFFWFLGEVFAMIRGRIRIGVILWSFLVILSSILPRILPQSYLKSCWDYGPQTWKRKIEEIRP